jgi:hypothetical protein
MSEKKISISLTTRQLRALFSPTPEATIAKIQKQVVNQLWQTFLTNTEAPNEKQNT